MKFSVNAPRPIDVSEAKRRENLFRNHFIQRGPSDCWNWTGAGTRPAGNKHRRGLFALAGVLFQAPRVAWALAHGADPGILFVCHTCDNPLCVNPAHLFLGTALDNQRDMQAKNRDRKDSPSGERNGRSRVTADQVREIRRRYASGEATQLAMAVEYNITKDQISRIINRKSWKNLI